MTDDDDPRRLINELSDSQKACLRLVSAGYTSKEIARETGLTPQTVDQYMSKAAAMLGASSRREAARLLTEAMDEQFSQSELSSAAVAQSVLSAPSASSPDSGATIALLDNASDQPSVDRSAVGRLKALVTLPRVGGKRHDMDWRDRVATILQIAFAAIVAVAAILAVTRGAVYFLSV